MSDFRLRLFSMLSLIALAVVPFGRADAQVSVTAADPSSAVQGTLSLDVTVTGNGFNNTATVKFLVTGTADPGGIVVKKVIVSGSKKLIATIDVADTAVVNKFDIEVALSSGRKGKGTTLFTVQPKQTGKPLPEPTPLPPPGSCSAAPGVFPAFAYVKARSHMKGRTRIYDGSDLYLANSTGSCSVMLLIDESGRISYRQIGSEVRIAWADGSAIRLLKLSVDNGNVVPVRSTVVYSKSGSEPYGVNDVELSRDGQTIYFTDEYSPAELHWQDTLKAIDIAACNADCTPQVLYTFSIDVGVWGLSINDADDRLYVSMHDRVPDIRTISFLQKQAGVWTSLRHVVSNRDSPYLSIRGFGWTDIGRWDYQSSSAVKDVLAYAVERSSGNAIDVIDVSNCGASGTLTCYGSGESALVRSGIAGHTASFTSEPASSDPAPNLLISNGYWPDAQSVTELDLDSMALTTLLEGTGAESAD